MKRIFFLSVILLSLLTTFTFGMMAGSAAEFNPVNTGFAFAGTMAAMHVISFLTGNPIFPANILSVGCGTIAANIVFNCAAPPQAGTRDVMFLINQEDWDNPDTVIVYAAANAMVIESITLPDGSLAYRVEGRNNSNAPSSKMEEQKYTDVFNHVVNFIGFDLTNAAVLNYQNMVGGRYVAIVEHNYRGATGESAFKVYGAGAGLKLRVFEADPLNADTQGAYVFGLGSTDESKEAKMPFAFFKTSYAVTKAAVEALAS